MRKYRVFLDSDGVLHLIKSAEEEEFLARNPGFLKRWLTDWTEFDPENSSSDPDIGR